MFEPASLIFKNNSNSNIMVPSLRHKVGNKTIPVSFGPGEEIDLAKLGFTLQQLALDKQFQDAVELGLDFISDLAEAQSLEADSENLDESPAIPPLEGESLESAGTEEPPTIPPEGVTDVPATGNPKENARRRRR